MLAVFVSVCSLWLAVTNSSAYRHHQAEDLDLVWTRADIPVEEPSGIVFHTARQTLFVVSDEGYLAELTTDLEPISRYDIAADLEGVTVHPVTNTLFLSAEVPLAIFEFDPELNRVIRRMDVVLSSHPDFKNKTQDRKGLEGLTIVNHPSDGLRLFAVVEGDPARLIELDADLSVEATDRARASNPADPFGLRQQIVVHTAIDLGMPTLSDLIYHAGTDRFLVLSSDDLILAVADRTGRIRRTVRLPGEEPEGLTFLPDGRAMLVDDAGGVRITSGLAEKLFKPLSP